MKSGTKILIPVVALSVLTIGGLVGVSNTFAQEENGRASWSQRFAEHFSLNKDDVDKFVEEEKETRRSEGQQRQEERLNQAVSDGKITEDQKNQILAKCEELQTEREGDRTDRREGRENFRNMTDEEKKAEIEKRQQERDSRQNEMKEWMRNIGIDIDDDFYKEMLPLLGGGGHRGGGHGGFGLGGK